MKKILKLNKTLIVLVIIITFSIISFLGLYQKNSGVWSDLLTEYNLGMELEGYRELQFSLDTTEEDKEVYVDDDGNILGYVEDGTETSEDTSISLVEEETTEETTDESASEETTTDESEEEYKTETRTIKANEDDAITIQNFDLTKDIIQKRLKNIENLEYNIRIDNVTGNLVVEVPDDDNISTVEALIESKGEFDIIDYQTGIVLLDNDNLSDVQVITSSDDDGYQLYLQITLDKEGSEKISEISKTYVETTDESGETSTQYISVRFEGEVLLSTYFGEEITGGTLTIPVGDATEDLEELSSITEQAQRIAEILNEEQLPLKYSLTSDNYIKSIITDETIFIAEVVCAVIILVISAILIVKFKLKGLVLSIVTIGYIALTVFLIRYSHVVITLNALYTLAACVILNYIFNFKLLSKLKKDDILSTAYTDTMKEYYLLIVPVIIIACVFTWISSVVVNSIGMTLFWGLFIELIYNAFVILTLKIV